MTRLSTVPLVLLVQLSTVLLLLALPIRAHAQPVIDAAAPSVLLSNRESGYEDVPLVKRRDGTYSYSGAGFDATIELNGSVRMRDRFARGRLGLFSRRGLSGEWIIDFFEVGYDLLGWMDKKFGNDPYHSERLRFLRATRDLREQLAIRAFREKLRHTLQTIWSRTGLTFVERRRRTFEVWDMSAEDELGQIGRAMVIEFIRTRCPEESPVAYGSEELRELNATRRSRGMFAPY